MASNDPHFAQKAKQVIGLYLRPPQEAAVFCVDEKSAIQALDRVQPVLALRAGRVERRGFEYVRHGTYSSWLNQVEIWFGMITSQCIRRGSFRSVRDLIQRIDTYIKGYNQNARPFTWTWTYRDTCKRISVPLISLSAH